MKFCEKCNNKLYPIEDTQKLYYKCNDCGEQQEYNEFIISETKYNSNISLKHSELIKVNKRYDPAFKRSKKYKCPNKDCDNSFDKETIIYCDENTIENIYMCCSCLTEWRYS